MEALALLCTLHADGPATLRRLRRAGFTSIQALETLEPERLADLLELTPAAARRLGREARLLGSRLSTGPLDREEAPEGMRRANVGGAPGVELPAPSTSGLGAKDRRLLDQVMDRWRRAEPQSAQQQPVQSQPVQTQPVQTQPVQTQPVQTQPLQTQPLQTQPERTQPERTQPERTQPDPSGSRPEGASARVEESREPLARSAPAPDSWTREPAQTRPPVRESLPAPTAVRTSLGSIDGLDATRVAALSDAGVRDLEALAAADSLTLATKVGEGFAEVRRWQFLARRALRSGATAPAPAGTPVPPRSIPIPARVPAPAPVTAPASTAPTVPGTKGAASPRSAWAPRKFWEAPSAAVSSGAASPGAAPSGTVSSRTEHGSSARPTPLDSRPLDSSRGQPVVSSPNLGTAAPRGTRAPAPGAATTLGWDFEIPPPPPSPPGREDERPGGPFA